MPSPPLVLITGGNGFIGYAVLAGALKAGYHVRAAVRRQDAIDTISRGPSIQKFLSGGALSFAIVPDNTKPDAYVEAAADCSYIIHVASPLAIQPGDLVSQALAGSKAVLEAAETTPSIKRIVFTASVASLKPFERLFLEHPFNQAILSGRNEEVPFLTADSRIPSPPPLPDTAPPFQRYYASKIAATNSIDDFAKTRAPQFSIVNLMPGWVVGPEELAQRKAHAFQGSNLILGWLFSSSVSLAPLYGLAGGEHPPFLAEIVHLDDVVEAHVNALDVENVPGSYRNFLLCSHAPGGPVMRDAVEIVRRELKWEVEEGRIPFKGEMGTIEAKFDASSTERELLGHPFRAYEEQVVDTVRWYVHLDD